MTVIPTLTEDERAVLLITREGGSIADIGDLSRWHVPINSLLKRGLLHQQDKFNNVITHEGIVAIEADQGALDGELKAAMGRFVETTQQPYGASIVNGKLFFKLLDGSTVTCECIGEPYASKIVEACRVARPDRS